MDLQKEPGVGGGQLTEPGAMWLDRLLWSQAKARVDLNFRVRSGHGSEVWGCGSHRGEDQMG